MFGKLFGTGGKGGKGPSPQEAIQKLRDTEEMLTKKQEFLEKKIEQELTTARKHGTKNKRGEGRPQGVGMLGVVVLVRALGSREGSAPLVVGELHY